MAGAAAIVEAEVRELVRRRGLDPILETAAVQSLIDDVISDYLDRGTPSKSVQFPESTGL